MSCKFNDEHKKNHWNWICSELIGSNGGAKCFDQEWNGWEEKKYQNEVKSVSLESL